MEARGARGRKAMSRTLALLYHDVVPAGQFAVSGFQSPDADIYKLDCEEFENHLEHIGRAVEAAPAGSCEARSTGDHRLVITFDDGGVSAWLYTADLLEQFGWRGYFFVTTDWINKPGFLSESQIVDLHRRGHIVGSHSCSHPSRMSHCTPEQLDREWNTSVQRLTGILGDPVDTASVPGGYYSREVAKSAARAGIRTLFTSEPVTSQLNVQDCAVFGRFSVQQGVSGEWVAALAEGRISPRLRRYAFWNAKKIMKTLGGEVWLRMRRNVIASRTKSET
jgi:peptidoglycan/xylan/chitin deacetylase (PgdA/CDA1 family)